MLEQLSWASGVGKKSLESQVVETIGISMQVLERGCWEQAPTVPRDAL